MQNTRSRGENSLPINEGEALLGVQLDDEVFGDLEVDIVSCRHCQNLTGEGVLVAVKPLRGGDKSIVFLQLLETIVGAALLADGDDVAGLDEVGRDVHALAVDGVG